MGRHGAEANAEMDAGTIWASVEFPMREARKGSLYRNEVTEAAVARVRARWSASRDRDVPARAARLRDGPACAGGCGRRCARPTARSTGNATMTATVLRKIRAADGAPGVLDELYGDAVLPLRRACGGRRCAARGRARSSRGATARSCRATVDGAVWITHLKAARGRADAQAAGDEVLGDGWPTCPRRRRRARRAARPTRPGARSTTRSAAASASCTSPSTTAR